MLWIGLICNEWWWKKLAQRWLLRRTDKWSILSWLLYENLHVGLGYMLDWWKNRRRKSTNVCLEMLLTLTPVHNETMFFKVNNLIACVSGRQCATLFAALTGSFVGFMGVDCAHSGLKSGGSSLISPYKCAWMVHVDGVLSTSNSSCTSRHCYTQE